MYNSSSSLRRVLLKKSLGSSDANALYSRLPSSAEEFGMLLDNVDVLLSLLSRFGGQTVRIPSRWPPVGQSLNSKAHELRAVVTGRQMLKIVAHFGGTEVYIPKCTQHLKAARNASIVKYFSNATKKGTSSGATVQRLAQRYQLSDRRIWSILKEAIPAQDLLEQDFVNEGYR